MPNKTKNAEAGHATMATQFQDKLISELLEVVNNKFTTFMKDINSIITDMKKCIDINKDALIKYSQHFQKKICDLSVDVDERCNINDEKFADLQNEACAKIEKCEKKIADLADLQNEASFADLQNEACAKIEKCEKKIADLQSEMHRMSERHKNDKEKNETFWNKYSVILTGKAIPIVITGENTRNVAQIAILKYLKIRVSLEDIVSAYRIGQKPLDKEDTRPIAVKLNNIVLKKELIIASRKQNSETSFYVNEKLSHSKRVLLFRLRQLKKCGVIKGCCSYNGKIYAYTTCETPGNKDVRHLIKCETDIDVFQKDIQG